MPEILAVESLCGGGVVGGGVWVPTHYLVTATVMLGCDNNFWKHWSSQVISETRILKYCTQKVYAICTLHTGKTGSRLQKLDVSMGGNNVKLIFFISVVSDLF